MLVLIAFRENVDISLTESLLCFSPKISTVHSPQSQYQLHIFSPMHFKCLTVFETSLPRKTVHLSLFYVICSLTQKNNTRGEQYSLRKHPFLHALRRWEKGDEEKRMFSQAANDILFLHYHYNRCLWPIGQETVQTPNCESKRSHPSPRLPFVIQLQQTIQYRTVQFDSEWPLLDYGTCLLIVHLLLGLLTVDC